MANSPRTFLKGTLTLDKLKLLDISLYLKLICRVELEKASHIKNSQYIKKILILQTAFIGDIILSTPLIRFVRKIYPSTDIQFLTIPSSKNILDTNPFINKLWIYDKKSKDRGIKDFLRLIVLLRKERIDLAIIPHRSLRSALLVFLSRIRIRIGFDKSSGSFLFTQQVHYLNTAHEIERNLHLITHSIPQQEEYILPEIFISETDAQTVTNWFKRKNLDLNERYICLAPGSKWLTKRWPAHYWGSLINLFDEKGLKAILIGAKEDKYLKDKIQHGTQVNLIVSFGDFSVRQSAEIIRRSMLLISNDSAPTHLGVAVRTPVLTIFGSTVPSFGFYPYGSKNKVAEVNDLSCRPCTDHGKLKCPLGHFKCMIDLTPRDVFHLAMEMLNEN